MAGIIIFSTLAVLIGLLVWWVRYKPLRDASLSLIREITGKDKY